MRNKQINKYLANEKKEDVGLPPPPQKKTIKFNTELESPSSRDEIKINK